METEVTKHAEKRIRKRLGFKKKSSNSFCSRSAECGTFMKEFKGAFQEVL